uniref:Lipopolysaccharide export system protein LptA n=1 Tax=Candidatus Kentrum sp. TUN TaxID=2126343 RepID=A0A450ZZQ3_9GAMM|nr:MAG: lipopolysaccharide transport protein LptA [Candidatus Kentron sp. TUN]
MDQVLQNTDLTSPTPESCLVDSRRSFARIEIFHNHDNFGEVWKRLCIEASWKLILICLPLWLPVSLAYALSTDRDQAIYIEADWAEANATHKTVVYKGSVVIIQGSMRIEGETITLYYGEDRTLAKAEVEGRPAQFQQRPDGHAQKQHAKANRMEYFANRDLILLLGNAHSWQGKQRVSAEQIEFDTKNSRVKAHGRLTRKSRDHKPGQPSKSRVRIVVPTKEN